MYQQGFITLTTDFGQYDPFVGIMKGIIHSINPDVIIHDLTHHIPSQDVPAADFLFSRSYFYFPENTVHVLVVDPGVGSGRRILAAECEGYRFVFPDNGILTSVLENAMNPEIVVVENKDYFLTDISNTFHGRDIFAPVAAHLSCGIPLCELGAKLKEKPKRVPRLQPVCLKNRIRGEVCYIDMFGNCWTNIDAALMPADVKRDDLHFRIMNRGLEGRVVSSYHEGTPHRELVALVNSFNVLEFSVNMGHAAADFMINRGDAVEIFW
ncbi:MAG: hypothetical protein D6820_15095, partial [Lentisphaerae bacterium]